MSDEFENIKKIKILNELFVGIGKDKIVIKDLKENPLEHITMLFGKSGELDIHKTKEGTVKEYESVAKINFVDIMKNLLSSGLTEEKFVQEMLSGMIKVDFTEEKFSDYKIVSQKSRETLSNSMIKNKKEARLTPESIQDMKVDDLLLPWSEGKQHVTDNCMVMKNNEIIGVVLKKDENYLFLPLSSFLENSYGQMIQNLLSDNMKTDQ